LVKEKGYVKLGEISMDEIIEKANYCLNCKTKPCQKGCPLGNNIPDFIKGIKEGKYEEAYNVLLETTVLQPICGRICPHEKQCQGSCVRGIKSTPVQIGSLEAFIGDMAIEKNFKIKKQKESKNKKVAVIGSGPTGITAAAFLAIKGYDVTIYEKYNKLGGLLRHGIPKFRLEKDILDKQINKILELGINAVYGKELGVDYYLEDLCKKYDAIFLSFGANISRKMNIPGENLKGVYGGNELLEKNRHPNYERKSVAVIGGGNVAMDIARTVKKMGAKEVKVIYRRAEEQMPAERKEVLDAQKEGVKFLFLNNILKINGDEEGKVKNIECIKTELVKKEGENRDYPVNIEGSNYLIDIDYVVMAVGSKPEENLLESLDLKINKWGYIDVDDKYRTSKNKVFAGGDLIGTKATVAEAARTGRNAAEAIDSIIG